MGKVFVHKPLKRAEQRALEQGPKVYVPEPPPVVMKPPEPRTVDVLFGDKIYTVSEKEIHNMMRHTQRQLAEQEYNHRRKQIDYVVSQLILEHWPVNKVYHAVEMAKTEKITDKKIDALCNYLWEMIKKDWSPKCLFCETIFTLDNLKDKLDHLTIFTVPETEEDDRSSLIVAGVCKQCPDHRDKFYKVRTTNLISVDNEPMGIRFMGLAERKGKVFDIGGMCMREQTSEEWTSKDDGGA